MARVRGAVDMTVPVMPASPLDGLDPDELNESCFSFELSPHDRITQRQVMWRGKVVEFALMHDTLYEDEWVEVARLDTCHSEIHIHRFRRTSDRDDRKVLRSGESIEEVDGSYEWACGVIMEMWEENRRRWDR